MQDFPKNKEYFSKINWTSTTVQEEIQKGLSLLSAVEQPIVSIFGSHLVPHDHTYYTHAFTLATELGERGFALASNGGTGIQHAVSKGATSVGARSIGLKMEQVNTPTTERVFTYEYSFQFLFVRRFLMAIKSHALIFYPGGYGTLNELFEYLTLMQNGVIDTVPVICVFSDYWQGLFDWIKGHPFPEQLLNNGGVDLNLVRFADSLESILKEIHQ